MTAPCELGAVPFELPEELRRRPVSVRGARPRQIDVADRIEDWIAALPPALHARRSEPLVTAWGFGAGPSFVAVHREVLDPPRSLAEMIGVIHAHRSVVRRAHLELADGSRMFFEPGAAAGAVRYVPAGRHP